MRKGLLLALISLVAVAAQGKTIWPDTNQVRDTGDYYVDTVLTVKVGTTTDGDITQVSTRKDTMMARRITTDLCWTGLKLTRQELNVMAFFGLNGLRGDTAAYLAGLKVHPLVEPPKKKK